MNENLTKSVFFIGFGLIIATIGYFIEVASKSQTNTMISVGLGWTTGGFLILVYTLYTNNFLLF